MVVGESDLFECVGIHKMVHFAIVIHILHFSFGEIRLLESLPG